jgi:hypothetical protein
MTCRFPIINKPPFFETDFHEISDDQIVEIPNLISKDLTNRLISYARDKELSGLHRRKSKYIESGFDTCLIYDAELHVEFYNELDHIWDTALSICNNNITKIEFHEVKIYSPGDKFDRHHDGCCTKERTEERKINIIIQLSDSDEYVGGDLYVGDKKMSRELGTGIYFPANYAHKVTELTEGNRCCLIARSWGPII